MGAPRSGSKVRPTTASSACPSPTTAPGYRLPSSPASSTCSPAVPTPNPPAAQAAAWRSAGDWWRLSGAISRTRPAIPGPGSLSSCGRRDTVTATVLVVDDEADLLFTVGLGLELDGYRILKASSGEEALEVVAAESPD